MTRILLIEPYRILRQAIALSLARDHEVETRESMAATELPNPNDYDLLVFDASSLEEKALLSAELLEALERCDTPLLWLEDDQRVGRPKTEKIQVLNKPLLEKSLKEAVAGLLALQNRDQGGVKMEATPTSNDHQVKGEEETGTTAGATPSRPECIDLVEVVGETAPENRAGRSKKER